MNEELERAVKQTLQKTGEQFRDLALESAATICDDLHKLDLGAEHCAIAIRELKAKLRASD